MRRVCIPVLAVVGLLVVSTAALRADVRTEEKSQVKFEGMMGRLMGMFGGKAAREGMVDTVAVRGNRMMTVSENTGEIIDLNEKKVYNLDMKKKTYEVLTFDEMRKRMQETQEKAAKAAKEQQPRKEEKPPEKQVEFDFSLKETGQKKTINGYDCREVVMVVAVHEKGKTLEQDGGMVMTSHMWLTSPMPELKEIAEFRQRYSAEMMGPSVPAVNAEQMAMAMALYPEMKNMIGKMETEKVNMEGAQILTEMVMETVRTAEQMSEERTQQQKDPPSNITSIGGIGGMLGRKLARKKEEKKEEPGSGQASNRVTIMTTNHELLKVSTSVSSADLSIPAGFKEKK